MAEEMLQGLEVFPQEDRTAIAKTLGALTGGFATRNADLLANVYASDADWVNAFGSVKKGSLEIVGYLRGLFADRNFAAGRIVAPPASKVRRVTPDIAIVSTRLQVAGQKLVGEGEIKIRDNHSLRVLQRQSNGQWLIVSEIYMDARDEQTYVNHS